MVNDRPITGIIDDIEFVVEFHAHRHPGPQVDNCLLDVARSRLLMERAADSAAAQRSVISALLARLADMPTPTGSPSGRSDCAP